MEVHVRECGPLGIYLNIKIILTYCDKQICTARVFSPAKPSAICQAVFSLREETILNVLF
jgi:hypothetical protein